MRTNSAPARSVKKREWKEASPEQREQAADLFAQNWVQADVARKLGVSKSTICRWYRNWENHDKTTVGPPGRRGGVSRLSQEQQDELKRELLRGPAAHGYRGENWSLSQIRDLIEKLFGIQYRTGSIWYVMRRPDLASLLDRGEPGEQSGEHRRANPHRAFRTTGR
jgi:transposase